ncbi:MAG: glycosyltransferase [bacterium]
MPLFQAPTSAQARNLLPANGQPVVIVPVFNAYEDVLRCYEAFFRNTPADVPLLVVDDAGWDRRTTTVLEDVFAAAPTSHDVVVLRQHSNKGFLLTMNDAFKAAGRADVVILNSDVVVGPEWLDRLRAAAYASSTVATATTLTNHGTIVSVPNRNVSTDDVPGGLSVDEAARRVAAASALLRPRIPTAIGHCAYIRRSALDLVGSFDEAFSPGYGEEVDFCQRAIAAGLEHVVADDVFVFHKGGSSFGRSPEMERRKYDHEQLVQKRYPYYGHWVRRVAEDPDSALAAALLTARQALLGLDIAIDGMCLGPLPAGTQIVVVEAAQALAARADVGRIVVYTPGVVPAYVSEAFRGLDKVRIQPLGSLMQPVEHRAHVVYRPYQVREEGELDWLRSVADRVVVNQLDLIAYHDAAYFGSDEEWRTYRSLAQLTAFTADGLTFLSEHSRDAARAEGLLAAGQPNRVVYCGTEHTSLSEVEPVAPPPAAGVADGFLLCLGVSYHHKNRLFALRMLAELRAGGWDGSLVLAGAHPPYGSSLAAESEFLLRHPDLAPNVLSMGMVGEAAKEWLYAHAGLVLYPTVSEGFGLVPFEAAHHGVACLSTRAGSLDEVLPESVTVIEDFDPVRAASTARALLDDSGAAAKVVDEILSAGERFTWAGVAESVMEVLQEVVRRPAARVVAIRTESRYGALSELPRQGGGNGAALKVVDAAVAFLVDRPTLRVRLVPPNSRRQYEIRRAINAVRKRL